MKSSTGFVWIPVIVAIVLIGGVTYAIVPRTILKDFFEKGDKPTEQQFGDPIDSGLNLQDDRKMLGLKEYDKSKEYQLGDAGVVTASSSGGAGAGDQWDFTGTVRTGASLGSVKAHCAEGLYLEVDPGLQMNARQTLLLLKDAQGQMITDLQYLDKRVGVVGTYPDENRLRCEALICGCEEYLIAERLELVTK